MGVIYLVRHGQASASAYLSVADAESETGGLTEIGQAQARRAGSALAARATTIDYAVCGSLARQQQTAVHTLNAFADAPGLVTNSDWNEYHLPPALSADATSTGAEFQRTLDSQLRSWIGGADIAEETYDAYRERAFQAITDLREHAGSGQTAVAVSSAGTISAIIAKLWRLDDEGWIRLSRTMINSGITKLIVGRGGLSVVSINDHGHVDATSDRTLMTFR